MAIFSDETNFFGLDIGTTAIRVVQLKGGKSSNTLATYGAIPVDQKVSQSDSQADKQAVSQLISKLVHDSKVSTKNVVVGLPTTKSYSAVIELPKMSDQEIKKAVKYQADQYIPVSVDDVELDWVNLGENEEGKIEVLLVASQKGTVESLFNNLENMGLNVVAIEPDSIALSRSLVSKASDVSLLLLEIGANSTDLVVVHKGTPRLIRSIPVGGNTFIRAASQNLSVDEDQAQQFVYKFGLTKTKLEGQVLKSIQSTINTLTDEIEKSIKFFNTKYQGVQLEKIIITGGSSSLPELPAYLANTMNLPVEIGNSWVNVSYPASMQDTLLGISSSFSVASGLAQRESE